MENTELKTKKNPAMHGGPGVRGFEKPKHFKTTWTKLIKYCKPEWIASLIAFVAAAGGAVFTLLGPNKLMDLTNLITGDGTKTNGIPNNGMFSASGIDLTGVLNICSFLVVIYAISFLLSFAQGFIMATATQSISRRLRKDVSAKINRVPVAYYNKTSFGNVLSLVTNDVDTIGQTMNQSLGTLISSVTLFFGSLIMMLITNAWMALAAIASTVIGFVLMIVIIRQSQKYFLLQQNNLGAMDGHVEETYSGYNVIKAYNGQKEAEDNFKSINKKLNESGFKSQFFSGLMMPIMVFIGNFGYVVVCVLGVYLVLNNSISFGVIIAFMIYVRLFTQPLSQLAQVATSLQTTAAASERVFDFLGAEEMADESQKVKHLGASKGLVELKDVKFGYDPDKLVIHDFSLKALPGQKIAIVGPTGAGKTTLVSLLMRFYEVNGGSIAIDGVSTQDVTREEVHNQFCMVLQDTWLFGGTIKENVIYCEKNVTDDQVKKACQAVGIDHYIMTLPKGYDTVLGEESSLSAGEKQQLTIARAMIKNAPMLILDEATSSVDTRTELQIQAAMDKLMEGRTSFVIAHRLSTIKNADLILVINEGDVVESGTHTELLAKNGFYANLYNSQFETF
jgi:ATP-binding cassette subfamily B protein